MDKPLHDVFLDALSLAERRSGILVKLLEIERVIANREGGDWDALTGASSVSMVKVSDLLGDALKLLDEVVTK